MENMMEAVASPNFWESDIQVTAGLAVLVVTYPRCIPDCERQRLREEIAVWLPPSVRVVVLDQGGTAVLQHCGTSA